MPIPTLTLTPSGQVVFLPDGGDGPALPEQPPQGSGMPFTRGLPPDSSTSPPRN